MSNLKEIKGRITAVKNTGKMTRAMKMISRVKLRGAKDRILNLRAYAYAMEELLKDVVLSQKLKHPFLDQRNQFENKKILTVILTGDRGLCGAFNSNICRFTEELLKEEEYKNSDLFFIGKKGHDYFKFRGVNGQGLILNLLKDISYPMSAKISKQLMDYILEGEYAGVFLIYNEFKSIVSPRVVCERFLPFDLSSNRLSQKRESLFSEDILFEVSAEKLLSHLLKRYFSIQLYRCFSENVAAEHGSRMLAMENATKNAEEAEADLNLKYNKLRQGSITQELMEIVSGSEALK